MAKFEYVLWLVEYLKKPIFKFQWDSGNESKSQQKHGILASEAEEIFYDKDILPLGIQTQPLPNEIRFGVIGKTSTDKILFVCFTVRELEIRIISTRKASKQEREIYEEKND